MYYTKRLIGIRIVKCQFIFTASIPMCRWGTQCVTSHTRFMHTSNSWNRKKFPSIYFM